MKKCAVCRMTSDVWDKVTDVVFAKKREEEKKKAIIIAVICASVALVVGAVVAAAVYLSKKNGEEKNVKVLFGKFKTKFKKSGDCECEDAADECCGNECSDTDSECCEKAETEAAAE